MMVRVRRAVALASVVVALAGCGAGTVASHSAPAQRTITVFAASSLTDLFTDVARQYEATNPGLTVTLVFGSSTTLAQQIAEGAPADVFAAASTSAMTAAGPRVRGALAYVSNHVVVAQPASAQVVADTGASILNSVRTWIQCAPEAPCGAAAQRAVGAFGVTTMPASLEPDVKSVVAKLVAGEADAGIVYLTDVRAAGSALRAVEFGPYEPGSAQEAELSTEYRIGQVDGGNPDAEGFVTFVLGPSGLGAATALGFTSPS